MTDKEIVLLNQTAFRRAFLEEPDASPAASINNSGLCAALPRGPPSYARPSKRLLRDLYWLPLMDVANAAIFNLSY